MLSVIDINDADFEKIVASAMDRIPEPYRGKMDNVGFVIEDEPNEDQKKKLHLHNGSLLFGLYEGIPLTQRTNNYSGVLPDKITIFKLPILFICTTRQEVVDQVNNTVWHEVAHHFGLDHFRISELEDKTQQ